MPILPAVSHNSHHIVLRFANLANFLAAKAHTNAQSQSCLLNTSSTSIAIQNTALCCKQYPHSPSDTKIISLRADTKCLSRRGTSPPLRYAYAPSRCRLALYKVDFTPLSKLHSTDFSSPTMKRLSSLEANDIRGS